MVQQIIRPTGLLDPSIEVRPIEGQIDDLIDEIQERVQKERACLNYDFNEKDVRRFN